MFFFEYIKQITLYNYIKALFEKNYILKAKLRIYLFQSAHFALQLLSDH